MPTNTVQQDAFRQRLQDEGRWDEFCTRRRQLQLGPVDVLHEDGITNRMADFSSRESSLCPAEFLSRFSAAFPLAPQLGSWTLVLLPNELVSRVFSIMRRQPLDLRDWMVPTGELGKLSVQNTAKTHTWPPSRAGWGVLKWASRASWDSHSS